MTRKAPIRLKPDVRLRVGVAAAALLALTACSDFDPDLRGSTGQFSTAPAALTATAARPRPDNRGVISYPSYQVVVAGRGDTVAQVAARLGLSAEDLGRFNGVATDVPLRPGEIIALPSRVAEPSPATGALSTGPIRPGPVDVTTLAGNAIDRAPGTASSAITPATPPAGQTGAEPIRHKVQRGETAYSIARLYNVPVRALASWNGLGPEFTVREGQHLLIPVAQAEPPRTASAAPETTPTAPGEGTPTPTPPSAAEPLPEDDTPALTESAPPAPVEADLGERTIDPEPQGRFSLPVQGTIIREYAAGRNDGISIQGAPGTAVAAAGAGTVAAITESAEGVPIIVVRHEDNLLTVYANVTDVTVEQGTRVSKGQTLASLRDGDQNFVHFEVRQGFDSVDPNDYLN